MIKLSRNRICVIRITGRDRRRLEKLLFKRYPNREWGSFFRFGYRMTSQGMHVTFVEVLEPRADDLKRTRCIVEFSADYILRTQLALDETALGVGVIHSHPEGCGTGASALDDDMDAYFSTEFATCGSGR